MGMYKVYETRSWRLGRGWSGWARTPMRDGPTKALRELLDREHYSRVTIYYKPRWSGSGVVAGIRKREYRSTVLFKEEGALARGAAVKVTDD